MLVSLGGGTDFGVLVLILSVVNATENVNLLVVVVILRILRFTAESCSSLGFFFLYVNPKKKTEPQSILLG